MYFRNRPYIEKPVVEYYAIYECYFQEKNSQNNITSQNFIKFYGIYVDTRMPFTDNKLRLKEFL